MTTEPPPPPPPPSAYPVLVEARRQEEYARFLPLVKWLLVIPHVIVLFFLAIGAAIAHLIAFFAVLITGRYPRAIFDFNVGVLRWAFRVSTYAYLLNDRYPPFSLEDDPDYPAQVEIAYPEEGVNRWRPLVHWLLVIPYALVAGVLMSVAGVVSFIGIFVILFTKDLPKGMFELILNPLRWQMRANAYAYYMVTLYPPFDWED